MLFAFVAFVAFVACVIPVSNGHVQPVSQILPDVTNKTLVLSLAELAANAYHDPKERDKAVWRNTTGLWTYCFSYGWQVDGLRGHVFSHREDDILTISVKGTSLNSAKDKESANMICSCNCCYSNCTDACNRERLLEGLPNMYLSLLVSVYTDLREEYPNHQIWFTGHSMGAVIASLAGVKTCHPSVGYGAPGEQLFANRIGLNHTCGNGALPPIYHIGYYRDPIFVGNCGWLCWVAGYRMDSICHHGYECMYKNSVDDDDDADDDGIVILRLQTGSNTDVFDNQNEYNDLGSGLIYTHTVNYLIDKVIIPNDKVPACYPVLNCIEKCEDEDDQVDEDETLSARF